MGPLMLGGTILLGSVLLFKKAQVLIGPMAFLRAEQLSWNTNKKVEQVGKALEKKIEKLSDLYSSIDEKIGFPISKEKIDFLARLIEIIEEVGKDQPPDEWHLFLSKISDHAVTLSNIVSDAIGKNDLIDPKLLAEIIVNELKIDKKNQQKVKEKIENLEKRLRKDFLSEPIFAGHILWSELRRIHELLEPSIFENVDDLIRRGNPGENEWFRWHMDVRLYGRDEQMDEIAEWLLEPKSGFLEIYGSAGFGKTRLSLETAIALEHGIRWREENDLWKELHSQEWTVRFVRNVSANKFSIDHWQKVDFKERTLLILDYATVNEQLAGALTSMLENNGRIIKVLLLDRNQVEGKIEQQFASSGAANLYRLEKYRARPIQLSQLKQYSSELFREICSDHEVHFRKLRSMTDGGNPLLILIAAWSIKEESNLSGISESFGLLNNAILRAFLRPLRETGKHPRSEEIGRQILNYAALNDGISVNDIAENLQERFHCSRFDIEEVFQILKNSMFVYPENDRFEIAPDLIKEHWVYKEFFHSKTYKDTEEMQKELSRFALHYGPNINYLLFNMSYKYPVIKPLIKKLVPALVNEQLRREDNLPVNIDQSLALALECGVNFQEIAPSYEEFRTMICNKLTEYLKSKTTFTNVDVKGLTFRLKVDYHVTDEQIIKLLYYSACLIDKEKNKDLLDDFFNHIVNLDWKNRPIIAAFASGYKDSWGRMLLEKVVVSPKTESWMAHLNFGADFMDAGDYKTAEKHFKRGLELNNSEARMQLGYAELLSRSDRLEEAAVYYQKALESDEQSEDVHFAYAGYLEKRLIYSEAESHYEKCIEINEKYLNAYVNYSNMLILNGEYDRAKSLVNKGLGVEKDNAYLINNLGRIYAFCENDEAAEMKYRKAIDLNNEFAEAHSNLAPILINKGELKEAEYHLLEAIRLKPTLYNALLNYGKLFVKEKRYSEALAQFRKAIEIAKDDPEVHEWLGLMLKQSGQLEEAAQHLMYAWESRVLLPDYGERILFHIVTLSNDEKGSFPLGGMVLDQALQDEFFSKEIKSKMKDYAKSIHTELKIARKTKMEENKWVTFLWYEGTILWALGKYDDAISNLIEAYGKAHQNKIMITNTMLVFLELYLERTGKKLPQKWVKSGMEVAAEVDEKWPKEVVEQAKQFINKYS